MTSTTMKPTAMNATRRLAALPRLGAIAAALTLAGCAVTPTLVSQDEVKNRISADAAQMYADQAPIDAPVSLDEAIARSLKYNLDYRLKKMESALAFGLADYARYDMLPQLLATAGYRSRNNDSGGTSIGIEDRLQSLRPSTSEERRHWLAGAEFSWNLLDFGVSYYRARQQADQFLIAEERRRKVVQNMLQDVRAAYWRALGAQRLSAQAEEVLKRANDALQRSREAESQRIIPPVQALNYQRALLDATSLLNLRRQDLEYAKRELAALMNVPPGTAFTVADNREAPLPQLPTDVRALEDLALAQRPELREEDLRKRITGDEARKQLLSMLPGITFDVGTQYDSNKYLYNDSWIQGGLRVSWNLMRLAALPSLNTAQERQVKTDEARRMALAMAILTQVRVGVERYRLAMTDLQIADTSAQVDQRLADYAKASVTARLDSDLEAVRTQTRALLGNYQRANAYANAQIAYGRIYNSVGLDPLPDNFEQDDLKTLSGRIGEHLRKAEKDAFALTAQAGSATEAK
ncbi:TolC family protein [Zoogloea sp.]|jgi:outer membrane protein TolC|uniref:TolC family protein n=1 Tax=Zoogloea sp. TaxID=49181 RepID=UPI0035B1CFEE